MPAEPRTTPPKIAVPPSLAFFAGAVLAATVLGSGAVLFFFNPSTHGFYPVCLFHKLTGLNCPGCGGTRAAYQLLHGHLLPALRDNALFILALVVLLVRGVWFAARKIRHQPATLAVPPKVLWIFLVIAIAFSVLRNLPAFSFLSP
jgi:flagellar biosynthesis protein FliQ